MPRDLKSFAPQRGLAQALRVLREEARMTPATLAERADLTASRISKIEAGQADPPWGTVRRLAAGLDVSMEDLAEAAERFEEATDA
jgi:transcriptional regulator with XRE-family HTH domain